MEFEFIEFYPIKEPRKKNARSAFTPVGTVHVYSKEDEIDLRGILTLKCEHKIMFVMPFQYGIDHKTNKKVRYDLVVWRNKDKFKRFMAYMHEVVKPIINQRLNTLESRNDQVRYQKAS